MNRIAPTRMSCDGEVLAGTVEFKTAEGEALAISIPRTETGMIQHFQERMPYGLFIPEH
jgi:hypothetical protein